MSCPRYFFRPPRSETHFEAGRDLPGATVSRSVPISSPQHEARRLADPLTVASPDLLAPDVSLLGLFFVHVLEDSHVSRDAHVLFFEGRVLRLQLSSHLKQALHAGGHEPTHPGEGGGRGPGQSQLKSYTLVAKTRGHSSTRASRRSRCRSSRWCPQAMFEANGSWMEASGWIRIQSPPGEREVAPHPESS